MQVTLRDFVLKLNVYRVYQKLTDYTNVWRIGDTITEFSALKVPSSSVNCRAH